MQLFSSVECFGFGYKSNTPVSNKQKKNDFYVCSKQRTRVQPFASNFATKLKLQFQMDLNVELRLWADWVFCTVFGSVRHGRCVRGKYVRRGRAYTKTPTVDFYLWAVLVHLFGRSVVRMFTACVYVVRACVYALDGAATFTSWSLTARTQAKQMISMRWYVSVFNHYDSMHGDYSCHLLAVFFFVFQLHSVYTVCFVYVCLFFFYIFISSSPKKQNKNRFSN